MDAFDVGVFLPAVITLVQIALNFLTGAWPQRPTGVAYAVAIAVGILGAVGYAYGSRMALDGPVFAQLVILGVTAAAGAAGVNQQGIRAEAKREQVTGESSVTPPTLGRMPKADR